ncbi:MAG: hypothetical protein ACUVTE_04540 [Candidatus Bathycorpusculaceae bacterium]
MLQNAQKVALTAVFAALHAILFLPEGPWRSFVVYLMPIEGIVLGPSIGFFSALIGSGIARLLKPTIWWMFGLIAEPLGLWQRDFWQKEGGRKYSLFTVLCWAPISSIPMEGCSLYGLF